MSPCNQFFCPNNTMGSCKKEDGICGIGQSGMQNGIKDYQSTADYSGAEQSDIAKAINGMFHDAPKDKYDQHMDICRSMNDIYRRKNHDYGDSFHNGFSEYGMLMPVIRLEDKFRRFKMLATGGDKKVENESIRDTLIDLANYAIMTIIEMDGEKNDGK